jgi:branched-chain amino acid transport system ATP-binding protein
MRRDLEMLKIQNLNVSIGAVDILRDVSMEVGAGAMVGLVGRNGAGKTTLIKSIMGLLKPKSGLIELNGVNLASVPVNHRNRLGVGYMPEDRRLIPDLTVEENILLPAWANAEIDAKERLGFVYSIIPELIEFGPRRGQQLSGGQQKLAAMGRSLMVGSQLLLLDEPFEGVAPALAQRLVEVIGQLKTQGMSIIFSESDLQHSRHLVETVFAIDRGEVLEQSL